MDQIAELCELAPGVQRGVEGGTVFYLLPHLVLPPGCKPERVDALLCPTPRDGYPSRLFFAEQVSSPSSRNWNGSARILERNWYAFSWTVSEPNLRLAQLVAAHLHALR
jgi:hypothetical protein